MNLVSKSDFARTLGITRQAIGDAISRGVLNQIGEGRKAKIDLDDYKTIQYQKNSNSQRKGIAEKLINNIKKNIPEKKGKNKEPERKKIDDGVVKENQESISITVPKKNGNSKDVEELLEIAYRLELAKTEKMEQQAIAEKLKNAARRGELISRERFYDIIRYLDKLHSNIERLADSFLSDIGGRIIDAGKIKPEHRADWKNEIMSQVDDTKNKMVEELKKIEKEQAL